ncbi:hypothetical protein [Microcystis phage MaeS]|nr:hypothetical protein [Microcystis phage MaeS]
MAFTKAQREKFIQLVRKYANASLLDENAKKLSEKIAKMTSTPQGMAELAQLITENLEEEMKAYDLRPLLFETRSRTENEVVEYRRKGKFRAYQVTKGGYVPKSQIFQDVVKAEPAEFAVRPSTHLRQLEVGRISSVNEMIEGAMHALLTEYARYFYAILEEAVGNDITADNYAEVTGEVDKATLDKMIHWAAGLGGQVNVVGTHQSLAPILDFAGHTDKMKDEIQRTGDLGQYRGAQLVKLEQFMDADDVDVIKQDTIFVLTRKVGYVDDFGPLRKREITDGEHDEFSIIFRKEMGLTVLYPEKVGMIKII